MSPRAWEDHWSGRLPAPLELIAKISYLAAKSKRRSVDRFKCYAVQKMKIIWIVRAVENWTNFIFILPTAVEKILSVLSFNDRLEMFSKKVLKEIWF